MYKITFKSEGGTYSFISKANSEYKALKDLSNRFGIQEQHLYRVMYCEPVYTNECALGGVSHG